MSMRKTDQPVVLSLLRHAKAEAAGLAKAGDPGGPEEGELGMPSSVLMGSCPSCCPDSALSLGPKCPVKCKRRMCMCMCTACIFMHGRQHHGRNVSHPHLHMKVTADNTAAYDTS